MVVQAFWSTWKTVRDRLLPMVVGSPLLLTAALWGGRGFVRAEDPALGDPRLAVQIESWFSGSSASCKARWRQLGWRWERSRIM